MKLFYISLFVFFQSSSLFCQDIRIISSLPSNLAENSGVLIGDANNIWLHNDGGDSAKLYKIDTFGTIQQTITVLNASNSDWEDITFDDMGNVYIGDFGNNNNSRQNLKIYKIPHPDSITGSSVSAQVINFYYPEQIAFPPIDNEKKYDSEAMVYFQNALYIFTKDRTTPHLGYTWMYKIPTDSGSYAAQLIDSFNTQQISYVFEVTAASLSPDGKKLALLNATNIWLFSDFTGDDFFNGTRELILLNSFTQKEGLDFLNDSIAYFTNESSILGAANLSVITLEPANIVLATEQTFGIHESIYIFPNPVSNLINLNFNLLESAEMSVSLYSQTGQLVKSFDNRLFASGVHHFSFSVQGLPAGSYFLNMKGQKINLGQRVFLKR